MEDIIPEGEVLEIEDPFFECLICEEPIEFEFEIDETVEEDPKEELPEEFKKNIATPENFTEEIESEMEENTEETMRVDCECGAEYLIKKIPGVPGFEVIHLIENEPELVEKEFDI